MEKKPIIIISAMEKTELNMLKNETNNIKTVTEGIYQFYETQIAGYPVVLCASKVGCINASSAITIGIRKYNPIAIINEGLAGSMTKKIHRHDLVIGQEVININSIKTPKRKAGEGVNVFDWELVTFMAGEEDRFKIEKADEKLLQCVRNIENKYTKGNVIYGRIGSGDIWNDEVDRIIYLNQKYRTLCEDMESIAVYQIANEYKIPVINIRVISDNSLLGEEYDVSTGVDVQAFIIELVKEYIK